MQIIDEAISENRGISIRLATFNAKGEQDEEKRPLGTGI
jgi:hypothetical protein